MTGGVSIFVAKALSIQGVQLTFVILINHTSVAFSEVF